jgi:hypothetical protein
MIKLSEKGRKILRAIYRGMGTAAISLTFGACNWLFMPVMYGPPPGGGAYGMPPEYGMPPYEREDFLIQGIIKSQKTGEPIYGISVWINEVSNYSPLISFSDGSFYTYAPMPIKDNYTIIFTDIDGERNGSYKQLTINLTKEQIEALSESPLIVELEEIEAEEAGTGEEPEVDAPPEAGEETEAGDETENGASSETDEG